MENIALTIGRFQAPDPENPHTPRLHEGHIALIRSVLDEGKRVVVMLRVGQKDEENPFGFWDREEAFRRAFPEEFGWAKFDGQRWTYEPGRRLHVLPVPDTTDLFHGYDCPWAKGLRQVKHGLSEVHARDLQ